MIESRTSSSNRCRYDIAGSHLTGGKHSPPWRRAARLLFVCGGLMVAAPVQSEAQRLEHPFRAERPVTALTPAAQLSDSGGRKTGRNIAIGAGVGAVLGGVIGAISWELHPGGSESLSRDWQITLSAAFGALVGVLVGLLYGVLL